MSSEKLDRRVRYTKMVLRESFIDLLKEKPVSKITIKEICDKADINRATFYAHYTDQFDLLRQIQDELIGEIISCLEKYSFASDTVPVEMLEMIFDYIRDNAEICALLLEDTVDSNFQKQVISLIRQRCIETWTIGRGAKKEDAEYIYTFSAYGCVGIIKKWLAEGMKKSSRDIAQLVLKLTGQGIAP